jgi:cytochrome P450
VGRNLAMAEMRTILAKMLWNFDFELSAQSERWSDQKIKTLWLKPELMCKVKVRNGLEKIDID